MKLIATFDVGTTAVKGVLVSKKGDVIYSESINIDTIFIDEYKEQMPSQWYEAFCEISRNFFEKHCTPNDIIGIIMSGQMQDLILVDEDIKPIYNAILYSDNRASEQAKKIISHIGEDKINEVTGNNFDGSLPLAKLLWVKENNKDIFNKIYKVMISSKDYCVTKLTNECVTDVTSAATSGMMDIITKQWENGFLESLNIDSNILPQLKYAHEQAGFVTEQASKECMYNAGTPVYTGTGDAGATTLASGLSKVGEFNINIGTSGWVACIGEKPMNREGVFNLAGVPFDTIITVVPFLNAGNVHKWISWLLSSEDDENKYEYVSKLLDKSVCGSNGLMFLPYLAGERFPVMDGNTKGCYIGITPETSKSDMVRACLEGVAFSIRQGIELIGIKPEKISLIGGGAKSHTWCQIMSDMLNMEVQVYGDSEYMPAIATAASVLLDMNYINGYSEFIKSVQQSQSNVVYKPVAKNVEYYNNIFKKYKNIYVSVKRLFI